MARNCPPWCPVPRHLPCPALALPHGRYHELVEPANLIAHPEWAGYVEIMLRWARDHADLDPDTDRTPPPARAAHVPPPPAANKGGAIVTGGIGDFLALESHLPESWRRGVRHLALATPGAAGILEILRACPATFPRLETTEILWDRWHSGEGDDDPAKRWGFLHAADLFVARGEPGGEARLDDWSITWLWPKIERGELPFRGSTPLRHRIADTGHLGLPARYVCVHPSSPHDRRDDRDLDAADWDWLLDHLERTRQHAAVVGVGRDRVPDHPRISDLTGRTTLPESIEVLKGATGFIGTSSCLSVLAAQQFAPRDLIVKGHRPFLRRWRRVYYAPRTHCHFLRPKLTYEVLDSAEYEWEPADA